MQTAPLRFHSVRSRMARLIDRLRSDRSGIAVTEFAIVLPVFVAFGMFCLEMAYMATTNMQISQLALAVADNASRVGQTDNSAIAPTISESGIDAVMGGALEQGRSLNFEQNGRIILSSLERDEATGRQYIHWQRCSGSLDRDSSYGNDSDRNGMTGTPIAGLGRAGGQVAARDGQAVMFVEVYYTYQPLFGSIFVNNPTFKQEAAFIIRDRRNLLGGGGDGLTGTATSIC